MTESKFNLIPLEVFKTLKTLELKRIRFQID